MQLNGRSPKNVYEKNRTVDYDVHVSKLKIRGIKIIENLKTSSERKLVKQHLKNIFSP